MASQQPIGNLLVREVSSDCLTALNQMLESIHKVYVLLVHGSLHNHLTHVLGSAYLLGGSAEHLHNTYKAVSADLEAWQPSSISISTEEEVNLHLGDAKYQCAFVDFFDAQLAALNGDWKAWISQYLWASDSKLLSGLLGGFGHPLIQLTDAFELANANLAVEALALSAVDHNPLAQLFHLGTDQAPKGIHPDKKPLEILEQMSRDGRFKKLFVRPGVQNTATILRSQSTQDAVLECNRSLDMPTNVEAADTLLREFVRLAVSLLCTISGRDGAVSEVCKHKFDFYLTHFLTSCWCLRVLVPLSPGRESPRLFRAVWLLLVLSYLHQQLPRMKPEILDSTTLLAGSTGDEWQRLKGVALGSTADRGYDPHFVKVLRTLWEFSLIWPEESQLFFKATIRFESEFDGWTGFGKPGEEQMDITMIE